MATRDIIVIGASAGGLDILKQLAAALPSDLKASIFVVWHMAPDGRGLLASILDGAGPLPALQATNNMPIQPGHIYVAAPDHHLLVEDGRMLVTRGSKENFSRPAIDPLFRSAALAYGRRVIGVVLTGRLDDGTAGLWTIKDHGGVAVVQDPADAEVPSMPESAIRHVDVDYVVLVSEMATLLTRLSNEEIPDTSEVVMPDEVNNNEKTQIEVRIAAEHSAFDMGVMKLGVPSPYTCPDCHGVLLAINEGKLRRYRCHTGHAFSSDSLLAHITTKIEESLWSSIRGIEESVMLLNHIGDHMAGVDESDIAVTYFKKANEAQSRVKSLREALLSHEILSNDFLADEAKQEIEESAKA